MEMIRVVIERGRVIIRFSLIIVGLDCGVDDSRSGSFA